MKPAEMIGQSELFAMNFVTKLKDANMQEAAKMSFFMDNQEKLQKIMSGLKQIIETIQADAATSGGLSTEDDALVKRAESLLNTIQTSIAEFQQALTISNNVTVEDTTSTLTTETLQEALKTNTTTQQIQQNMSDIAEQQKQAAATAKATSAVGYNYCLVIDGQLNLFAATTKDEINANVNQVVNSLQNPAKAINLYQVAFTPVKLHKQTILSV